MNELDSNEKLQDIKLSLEPKNAHEIDPNDLAISSKSEDIHDQIASQIARKLAGQVDDTIEAYLARGMYEDRPMTWEIFLKLKTWATENVEKIGYPIYITGEALSKQCPKNISIGIAMPTRKYNKQHRRDIITYSKFCTEVPQPCVPDEYYVSCVKALDFTSSINMYLINKKFIKKESILLAAPEKVSLLIKFLRWLRIDIS